MTNLVENPVDFHIVSWNRPKMTELVIKTIHRNTMPGTFRIHVLDNGSTPETIIMLESLHNEGLIHNLLLYGENKGLEWARQELFLKCTTGEYFVDIDNDCLPPQLWLDRQIALMERYPQYSAISQRTQVMIGTGNIFEDADRTGEDILDFPHPGGSLRLMRASDVREVGGWDRDSSGRGSEERYICGKLRDAGHKTAFAVKLQCLHLFGTRDDTNRTDRWGYDAAMKPEDSGHSDIWHPALGQGDDYQAVVSYTGEKLAKEYFDVDRDHTA